MDLWRDTKSALLQAQSVVQFSPSPSAAQRETAAPHCVMRSKDVKSKTASLSIPHIPANNTVLLELVYDVIVDMAEQSQAKMDALTVYLRDIRTRYLEASDLELSAIHSNSTSSSSAASLKKETVKLPCSLLLPLGETGGRQHERLLRVVQTLQSMTTNRVLVEVTPAEQLTALWASLEAVFVQLRSYLVDADDESGGSENIPAQTTLTSILNRLLPAVESFFLVHTVNLLADKPAVKVAAATKESSSSSTAGASSTGSGEVIAGPAMPDTSTA
eukprot:gene34467-42507_t